jgi:3-oxoacyl-(acyl-carrier-protein) synthase
MVIILNRILFFKRWTSKLKVLITGYGIQAPKIQSVSDFKYILENGIVISEKITFGNPERYSKLSIITETIYREVNKVALTSHGYGGNNSCLLISKIRKGC